MQGSLLTTENSKMLKTKCSTETKGKTLHNIYFFLFRSQQKSKQKHLKSNQIWFLFLFSISHSICTKKKKKKKEKEFYIHAEKYTKLGTLEFSSSTQILAKLMAVTNVPFA